MDQDPAQHTDGLAAPVMEKNHFSKMCRRKDHNKRLHAIEEVETQQNDALEEQTAE